MKPRIICHMLASLDGSLHPSRYTESPDGSRAEWSGLYEKIHKDLEGDAWIVGRVTMAEMSKAAAHPPEHVGKVDRPHHFARRDAGSFAVALDASGKLHFAKPDIGGDHVVVLLGYDVADSHLAELATDGVSYIVSQTPGIDLAAMLDVLGREFGIRRLLLEGGAGINGSFLAAGLVDELSLLIAPALDARAANQGFVEFGESGLADKVRLSLKDCKALAHGLVHLRYAVTPG
ncbi:RibD family protein [Mesorhizobium sp. BR115XR7A]|uniref:RibD family protein n=1 Tax=Mesorhizobium sp. BR115XR7A TaxID=2876645 RepID=UPI001CCC3312|nr:RibD family protein [Mesorhizobium sp. BR115XR7A]MBZ9906067.1 RibD family protein [Mesorhizobium sp. BR115XR7A]MBZ9932183.1 RibD family protein [Mesorhizobium sp. BR1-1-5]